MAASRKTRPSHFRTKVAEHLAEIEGTPEKLAETALVPVQYINDLLAGRRRPPLPSHTDIYDRMTRYLRCGRKVLADCADADREGDADAPPTRPSAAVTREILSLCEPATAAILAKKRRTRTTADPVAAFLQRVLTVVQGTVRRQLDDQVALRVAATRRGLSYEEQRVKILDFLDSTAGDLTMSDVAEFIGTRVARWDVDIETDVVRVVLKSQEPRAQHRRSPSVRRLG